jgi:hypothetical protein
MFGLALLAPNTGRSQTLTNGLNHAGTVLANTTNTYTFSATNGNSIILRVGTTNFTPRLELYGPGGTLIATAFINTGFNHDVALYQQITNTGTFTVAVSSQFAGGSGTYGLRFAQIPGPFTAAAGDQGGLLTNGTANPGAIPLGDLDMWSFSANAGDTFELRIGATNFTPRLDLYGPGGALIATAFVNTGFNHDVALYQQATNTGTYTVVVSSQFYDNTASASGTYSLHLARVPGPFVVSPGEQGGALTNGTANPGALALGALNMWSFSANTGDNFELRIGTTNFTPRLDLYGPGGALIATAFINTGFNHDVALYQQATNTGTYTVVVSSQFYDNTSGASGTYSLHLAQAPEPFVISTGDQGGPLTNGTANPGAISLGGLDMWSFSANKGDNFELRIGTTNFTPRIDLYGPGGALIATAFINTGFNHDVALYQQATNSGTYTVVVSSQFYDNTSGASGTYSLHLAQAPEPFVVSPGDQGGPLTNGTANPGAISLGGLDMWSFNANAGDNFELRIGTTNFTPRLDLYGPGGALIATAFVNTGFNHDVALYEQATNSGTYTVVVSSQFYDNTSGASGPYSLHLAQAPEPFAISPGQPGGSLTNGTANPGTLALGALNMWSFNANTGDSFELRIGTTNFTPRLDLYGPGGALIATAFINTGFNHDVALYQQATNSGTYTVVVSSQFYDNTTSASGTYSLHLAQAPEPFVISPGEPGGALANGASNPGALLLGALNMWSFSADAGDSIVLRIGTTNFTPRLDLYGPNGALLGSAFANNGAIHDATLPFRATNSGAFTVVVSSYFYDNTTSASGTYALHLALIPGAYVVPLGDAGGSPLRNGISQNGIIDLGDQDLWRFVACNRQFIRLTCQKLSSGSFSPRIRLYDRDGALLATAVNASTAVLNFVTTYSGAYTALVDGGNLNDAGTYQLTATGITDPLSLCPPLISGTNLDVGGIGGAPRSTFILYSTTNLATPGAQWTPVLTNQLDQFGVFDFSTHYNPALRQQFFRLFIQ